MTPNGLRVDGVTKRFAGITAVDDVSLAVMPGQIVGLMGPNGSGKSTLLNVISGVLKAEAGRVTVDGDDVTGHTPFQVSRSGVARTFQTARLFNGLSVHDNVAAAMRNPRQSVDAEVKEFLDLLDISRFAQEIASSLPYGIQRRVEIARALASGPKYLLLDEPAAGLNSQESRELQEIIRSVSRDETFGCGVLIIDHDIRLIVELCEVLHVLVNGKTLAAGDPNIVREDPEVVRAYIGGGPEK